MFHGKLYYRITGQKPPFHLSASCERSNLGSQLSDMFFLQFWWDDKICCGAHCSYSVRNANREFLCSVVSDINLPSEAELVQV